MRGRSFQSLLLGVTTGVLISWGCSVTGDVQDAGAQDTTSGLQHELISVSCGDETTSDENGTTVVTLAEGVSGLDRVVGLTYGRRSADGSFSGTSGVPVIAEDSRIVLRGTFAGAFSCDAGDVFEIVLAKRAS